MNINELVGTDFADDLTAEQIDRLEAVVEQIEGRYR